MVKNPESDNFDIYDNLYSRSPYPHASVERITLYALNGELEATTENPTIRQYFNNLIRETDLDLDAEMILRRILIFGDAFVRLVKNANGDIINLHHLISKDVEIQVDGEGEVKEYMVTFGGETRTYSIEEILHFKWNPQESNPYGTSILKGLQPVVNRENQIMDGFLNALHAQAEGKPIPFDSEGNLRTLKAIPYVISNHTKVPIGLLTLKIENEAQHSLQMKEFEKMCQSLRDVIRNEYMEKIVKPETERKEYTEVTSIGWKRKNRPTHREMNSIMAQYNLGLIPLEDMKKLMGLEEYYV